MHNPAVKKERASLVVFALLSMLVIYFLFGLLSTAYRHGVAEGLLENTYYVPPKAGAEEGEVFDHRQLMKSTPELIALGSKLYGTNCVSCHGDEGKGNGASGMKLNPRPRDYHAPDSEWKNGTSVIAMFHTLEKGINGMPNFPALNPKQKFAVVHYVHATYMKERGWKEDAQSAIDGLPKAGGAVAINIDPYAETRVPVRFAMDKLIEETPQGTFPQGSRESSQGAPRKVPQSAVPMLNLGRALYTKNCQDCHGARGEGTAPPHVESALQLRELAWGHSLLKSDATWPDNYDRFRSIVATGMPNGMKPGFATLTDQEMKALFEFTKTLR